MADELAASLRRLGALASERIEWPSGEGVEVTPGVLGGEPCFAGHRIEIGMIRHWADDEQVRRMFPQLTPEALRAARAYLATHADLFTGDRYRMPFEVGNYPETFAAFRDDLRALLAAYQAREAQIAALRGAQAIVDEYASAHHAYDTMPPRPRGSKHASEVGRWEAQRLDMERRIMEAEQPFRAMLADRARAALGEGRGA